MGSSFRESFPPYFGKFTYLLRPLLGPSIKGNDKATCACPFRKHKLARSELKCSVIVKRAGAAISFALLSDRRSYLLFSFTSQSTPFLRACLLSLSAKLSIFFYRACHIKMQSKHSDCQDIIFSFNARI